MKFVDKNSYYYGAKKVIYIFIVSVIISYLYTVITGSYNGDFLGVRVNNHILLFFNLVISILPFCGLWIIYKYFKARPSKYFVSIPYNLFEIFFFFIILWHILVTLIFGVGVMTAQLYEAPPILTPLIQIMNRFHPFYVGLTYILMCRGKFKEIVGVILLIIVGLSRSGLGIFLYLGVVLLVKYNEYLASYVKKHLFKVILIIFLFPVFVNFMYGFRDVLRTSENKISDDGTINLITGKLIGRLSSFSNSAIILQEPLYFFVTAQSLDLFFYQKQVLGGILGVRIIPENIPERHLIQLYSPNTTGSNTYMCGTPGILIISLYKSSMVLFLNLGTIFFLIILTFKVIRLLNIPQSNELALCLLVYPVLSGVGNEFSFLLVSFIMLFLVCLLFRSINSNYKKYINEEDSNDS